MGRAESSLAVRARPGVPPTRPRARVLFLVPVLVAAATGAAVGVRPDLTLVSLGAAVSAFVLGLRLDWAVYAVVAASVFEGYLDAISPWTTDWLAVVLVLAWALRRAGGPLHPPRTPPVLASVAVLAAVIMLAAIAHPNGRQGVVVCLRWAEVLAVLLVLADALAGPVAPRRAARVYVLACVAASVCGILEALAGAHRVAGPVRSPDHLAFLLVGAIPLVAVVSGPRARPPWTVWASALVLVAAVLGTESRGAYVALGVIVLAAGVTGAAQLRRTGVLLLLVGAGAAFVLAVLPQPVGDALDTGAGFAGISSGERAELWHEAASMTRDHPVLGLGPGAFALHHRDHAAGDRLGRDSSRAHSTVLEASAELGGLGAVALLVVLLVPAAAARRRWLRDRSPLAAGAGLALVGAATCAVFESEQLRLSLWFLVALAAVVADRRLSGRFGPET